MLFRSDGTPGTSAATAFPTRAGNTPGTFDTWLVPAATDANFTPALTDSTSYNREKGYLLDSTNHNP